MIQVLISIVAFLLAIGILVVFHEWGHFWVARKLGVKVLRFSVGFGKPLWRYQAKSGVEYCVCAIPLGGYVKMLDEREEPVPEALLPFAFNRKPVWSRFLIVLAGPVFNFIFAILAYWIMFMIGINSIVARIGEVVPDSIAYHAGLHAGDEIIQVDDIPTVSWQQVHGTLIKRLGDQDKLKVVVKSPNNPSQTHWLSLESWELKGQKPNLLHALGITPYQPDIPPVVESVVDDSAATQAGILPADEIIALNGTPIKSWQDFTRVVTKHPNEALKLTIIRQGQPLALTVTPRLKEMETGEKVGFVGLMVKIPPMPPGFIIKEHMGPLSALKAALDKTQQNVITTFHLLGKMIVGKLDVKHLSGPISIAEGAGATAVMGISEFLGFLALISISLGVLNLLPIPILDGGHLLFYLVEGVLGRPVSDKVLIWGFKLGFMFLIFLMMIAFYNDLVRFF